MAKIGFTHYDKEETQETTENKNRQKKEAEVPAQVAFKKFITSKYEPFGPTKQTVYRTSKELQYECREMCEPSLPDVAKVMEELGYKSDLFCGQYTWILYETIELRY